MTRLRRRGSAWIAVVLVLSAANACDRTHVALSEGDAAAPGGSGPLLDAETPLVQGTVCGDAACPESPNGAPLGEIACCLASGGCGLRPRALSMACLAHGGGNVDPTCPGTRLADGTRLQGCCTPDDRCGLYDRLGDLGCIPSAHADGGDAGRSCKYSPTAACLSVVEATCDGKEDCSGGDLCCARSSHGAVDAFGCFASCKTQSQTTKEVWLEICHSGDVCEDPEFTCHTSGDLTSGFGRCRQTPPPFDAGAGDATPDGATDTAMEASSFDPKTTDASAQDHAGVVCGNAPCGAAEKCCFRAPVEPYCAPANVSCTCSGGGGAGGGDAAGDSGDADTSSSTGADADTDANAVHDGESAPAAPVTDAHSSDGGG